MYEEILCKMMVNAFATISVIGFALYVLYLEMN